MSVEASLIVVEYRLVIDSRFILKISDFTMQSTHAIHVVRNDGTYELHYDYLVTVQWILVYGFGTSFI